MSAQAVIMVQAADMPAALGFDTPLEGLSVLERVAANVSACRVVDQAVIATDIPELLSRGQVGGLHVRELPANMRACRFTFLDVTLGRISMETHMYAALGLTAPVVAQVSWDMPLLGPLALERMYHALLDDPLPARVAPVHPVDPGLFTCLPGAADFFPVWSAPGVDRQSVPQLYRPAPAAVSLVPRMGRGVPTVKGLRLDRSEMVRVRDQRTLELAAFLIKRFKAGRADA